MKIRQGFVSNSSTTSFSVIGDWVKAPDHFDDPSYEMELLEEHLCVYSMDGEYAVGLSYDDMKKDETKAQFEQRIKDLVFKHLGVKIEVGLIEESFWA